MKRFFFGTLLCLAVFAVGIFTGKFFGTAQAPAEVSQLGIPVDPPVSLLAQVAHNGDAVPLPQEPVPFAASTLNQVLPQQQTLQFEPSGERNTQLVRDNSRFDDAPRFDSQPGFDASNFNERPRLANESALVAPDLGGHRSFSGIPSESPSTAPIAAVDVMDGMSFALHVTQKAETSPQQTHRQTRMIGQTPISYAHSGNIMAAQQLHIFAEAVELTDDGDDFRVQCSGKVVIVANQSMLSGDGLEYAGGQFKINSPDITTPDAVINAADSSFDYPIGAVTLYRLPKTDEKVEAEPVESPPPFESVTAPSYSLPPSELDPGLTE